MPRMSQNERMIYVRDIVDRYKRINVTRALERFCVITGMETNASLRNNISNDLNSLEKIGYVFKEYFYLDGAPMDYETAQDAPTKDVQYVLTSQAQDIFGIGLLEHCESMLISTPSKIKDWSIVDLSGSLKDDDLSFAMKMDKNGILGINISALEIPLTLLIANKPHGKTIDAQALKANYGNSSALLLVSEQGVEPSKKNSNHAHAIIKFSKDDTKFEIRDMESKHGTFFCEIKDFKQQVPTPTKDPIFNELKYKATKNIDEVIILDPEPLTLKREWVEVSSEDFSLVSVPALIRLGGFVFNITKVTSH